MENRRYCKAPGGHKNIRPARKCPVGRLPSPTPRVKDTANSPNSRPVAGACGHGPMERCPCIWRKTDQPVCRPREPVGGFESRPWASSRQESENFATIVRSIESVRAVLRNVFLNRALQAEYPAIHSEAFVFKRLMLIGSLFLLGFMAVGCQQSAAPARSAGAGMQAMPVQTVVVALQPVPQSSEYVATIKSRRSATMQPQVAGRLTEIMVHSGDQVHAGQPLMTLDALQQQAMVNAQRATEQQKKAVYDYDTLQYNRQKKLYDAGHRKPRRLPAGAAGPGKLQGGLRFGHGLAQNRGGTTGLLHRSRAVRRRGRGCPGARGRLCHHLDDADHRGRKQRP